MCAGGTTVVPPAPAAAITAAPVVATGKRLPWTIAAPLIGALSLGLWFGIWKAVRLMLAR
jgi:hypothetical protein